MNELVWFVLASHGLTQILVYGTIFDSVRPTKGKLGELFHCPMCLGFLSVLFLFGINAWTELFTFDYTLVNALVCGWLSSATSYALSMIVGDCGFKVEYVNSSTSKEVENGTNNSNV